MATYTIFNRIAATLVRAVLWTAVVASIISSAYLGFTYGAQLNLAFGVLAVCAEVFKPVCLQLGLDYLGNWRTCIKAPLFLGIGIVCVAYSLVAELGLSATSRGDIIAARAATVQGAEAAKGDRQRALDELAALKPSRPLAELDALVKAARPHCVVHISFAGRNTECSKDGKLLAEQGRAQRRAELETRLARSPYTVLSGGSADPQAETLAALYADVTSQHVSVDSLSKRLPVMVALLIEVVSSFGVMIAKAGSAALLVGAVVAVKAKSNPEKPIELPPPQDCGTLPEFSAENFRFPRQKVVTPAMILDVLEAADEPLANFELADALGISDGECSRQVARMNGKLRKDRVGHCMMISLRRKTPANSRKLPQSSEKLPCTS